MKFRAKAVEPKYKGFYLEGFGICFEHTSAWLRYKGSWIEVSKKSIEVLEITKTKQSEK